MCCNLRWLIYLHALLFAVVANGAPSCRDPMAGKTVDRWFMLTTPQHQNAQQKTFGFLWATAASGEDFGFAKAVTADKVKTTQNINQILNSHVRYTPYSKEKSPILFLAFADTSVHDQKEPGETGDKTIPFSEDLVYQTNAGDIKIEKEYLNGFEYKFFPEEPKVATKKPKLLFFNRAHSKWMIAIDTKSNSGYVIMHSWPNAPVVPPIKEYIVQLGSFDNTQHALCMNLDDVNAFLTEAVSAFPRLIFTNYGTDKFDALPSALSSLLMKLKVPSNDEEIIIKLKEAQSCLAAYQNSKAKPDSHVSCMGEMKSIGTKHLVVSKLMPSLFNEKSTPYVPGKYYVPRTARNPVDIIPSPWIGVKLRLEKRVGKVFPITLLWEHSYKPQYSGTDLLLPAVPGHVVYTTQTALYTGFVDGKAVDLQFTWRYMHAKLAIFINYVDYPDRDQGYICVGDANHTPAVSVRAGMTLCFQAKKLARDLFEAVREMASTTPRLEIPSQNLPYGEKTSKDKPNLRDGIKQVYADDEALKLVVPSMFTKESNTNSEKKPVTNTNYDSKDTEEKVSPQSGANNNNEGGTYNGQEKKDEDNGQEKKDDDEDTD